MPISKASKAFQAVKTERFDRKIICGANKRHQIACKAFNKARRQDSQQALKVALSDYESDQEAISQQAQEWADYETQCEQDILDEQHLDYLVYIGEAEYPVYDDYDDYDDWYGYDEPTPMNNIEAAFDAMVEIQAYECDCAWWSEQEQYEREQELEAACRGDWLAELEPDETMQEPEMDLPTLEQWHKRKTA